MKDFIRNYLARGFGKMSKSEIEAEIFHRMMELSCYATLSDFELSMTMKVSEAKIKNLKYNDALMYKEKKEIEKSLRESLLKATFRFDGKRIVFSLPNRIEQQMLKEKLATYNRVYDTSFVSDNVVLYLADLIFIINIIYTENEKTELLAKLKVKDDDGLFDKIIKKISNIFDTAKKTVDFSIKVSELVKIFA